MEKETKYVVSGELRKKVLSALNKPNAPTVLAKNMGSDRPSVSRSLIFLSDKGLVRCMNDKDKRGRIYELTEKGRRVLKDLSDMRAI